MHQTLKQDILKLCEALNKQSEHAAKAVEVSASAKTEERMATVIEKNAEWVRQTLSRLVDKKFPR